MADQAAKPDAGATSPPTARPAARVIGGSASPSSWRLAWQIPALAIGLAGLVFGAIYAFKTSPLPDFPAAMGAAESMLERQEYDAAIEYANTAVYPFMVKGVVAGDEVKRYHLLIARGIARGQKSHSLNVEANHRNVLTSFEEARKQGAIFTAEDMGDIAAAQLALGNLEAAMEQAAQIPGNDRAPRDEITKRVIERTIRGPKSQRGHAVEMLSGLLADADLPLADRVWALSRQAELLIDQGYPEEAIDKLLRAMPRLPTDGTLPGTGELYVWLARAYMDTRNLSAAASQLERAAELLPAGDPLLAKVDLMAAGVLESRGELSEARERYQHVVTEFADAPEELEALLGLAGVYAQREEHQEAADTYAELVSRLVKGARHHAVTPVLVAQSLMSRFRERFDAEDDQTAHRYCTMAEDLFGAEQAPDDVIQGQADVNRRLADQFAGGATSALAKVELDPATLLQVQRHFRSAARYYRVMADRTVVTDPAVYLASLWAAADCFDRSGDRESAIAAFDEFTKSFPDDPKQPEARFRLAEAYKALGDLQRAAELYRALIDAGERGNSAAAGPFADASYVPLAQTYLLDNDPANDKEAEQKLLEVASGRLGGTGTATFREAVIELGNLYFQTGQYEQGVERLREAMARYPDDARAGQVRFRLAECNRMSASAIEKELGEAMPDARRNELVQARSDRLRDAAAAYEEVRRSLEAKDPRRRSALEDLMMRNSSFYVADCAFDLEQYDTAIRLYDAAREKYSKDPASLVAMAQIVSAHLKQGDLKRAATANERARRFYASLPESAWNDPNLPMTRREWERWLEATAQLGAFGESPEKAKAAERSAAVPEGKS